MTIMEALHRIDSIKPNTYSQQEKVKWLSALDGIIYTEIINTHEGAADVEFEEYTENTDLNLKLLVPAPYDELYIYWLESKIDYFTGEMRRYNNSITMYNSSYAAFARYYHQTHLPHSKTFKFFGQKKTPEYQVATEFAKVSIEEDQ
jgi:hypothetical protein